MQIYTMGFTKKSAETFFELIRKYEIEMLIDIRLNNHICKTNHGILNPCRQAKMDNLPCHSPVTSQFLQLQLIEGAFPAEMKQT